MASGLVTQIRPTIAFNYESITVDNTSGGVALTPSKYAASPGQSMAEAAFITVENGPIRYRYDGGAPTASEGHKAPDGSILVLRGQNQMKDFRAIRTGTTNGILRASYERE